MIRKVRESILRYCKFWLIGMEEEEEEKQPTTVRVWFPATKDHQYD